MRYFYFKLFILFSLPVALSFAAKATIIERSGKEGEHAVVFIPGLASHGALWEKWAAEYAGKNDVFVVTLSGFAGEPARAEAGRFLAASVSEIVTRLNEHGVSDVTLVGHSIGGLISLMIANQAPSLVRNILVVDSLPYLAGLMMPGLAPAQAAQRAAYFGEQMKKAPRAAFLAQQRQGMGIQSKTAAFLPTLIKWGAASDQATIANAFVETLSLDYRPNLAGITAQVTVLAAYDKQMPVSKENHQGLYEAQYASLQNGHVEIIGDSFHFIMIDQPQAFSKALAVAVEEGK